MTRQLLSGVLALVATTSFAAEWSIEPSVNARTSVTDNVNFTPGTREATRWVNVSPQAKFSRRTETTEVSGVGRLSFNRYPGRADLDANDSYFSGVAQFHEERARWGLTGFFYRDSTLQSELATTGLTQVRRQRSLSGLSPSWNYAVSERGSVFANFQYNMADYEQGSGLKDYSDQQASLGYQYLLSETTALSISAGGSRFETKAGDVLTDTRRADAGLTHAFSERLSVGLSVGYRYSDTRLSSFLCPLVPAVLCDIYDIPFQEFVSRSRDQGLSLNATADYGWERTLMGLRVSRNTNPSGSGLVVVTEQVGGSIRHDFSEKLSGSISGDWLHSRYVAGPGGQSNYHHIDASAQRRIDDRWTLSGGLSHAWQDSTDTSNKTRGTTAYVNLAYEFSRHAISR
ncbi:MAG: hypothetical protein ACKVP2_14655 [Burkholderiales bacterium]